MEAYEYRVLWPARHPRRLPKEIGKSGAEPEHLRRYAATVEKYTKWVRHKNSNDAPDANIVYRRVLATTRSGLSI